MKNPVYATILAVALLFSCSTSDEGEEIPPENAYELEEKILGKWDVENQDAADKFRDKQTTPVCYIFSLIFNTDGTFIINYQDGTITGNYEVEGENLISLGNAGSIGNIRFSSYGISFSARLENICSRTLSAVRDDEHTPGTCYTFLNCLDGSFWVSKGDESVAFLKFKNQPLEEFFVRQSFFTASNCRTGISNETENVTSVMIANYTNDLKFILEEEAVNVYSYTRLENGNIREEIETTEGTSSRVFEPASEEELDAYTGYVECGEKTYVPDDVFEKELIKKGYDDVMDDYVLTENINSIQQFWMNDADYPDEELETLTGIEDFTALSDLSLQMKNLPEIDLSGNINLETLFLGSPALTSLDLSHNTKLRGLYVEFAPISTLDISKNTELVGVELQLMSLPSLDISKNSKLEMLTIEGSSGFKELIAVESPVLWHLNLSDDDQLENVDVSYFPNLKELILSNNRLSALDVSTLGNLEMLEVQENALTALDVSNNDNLYHFWASKNPDLDCIQIAQVHLDRFEEENPRVWWGKDETTSYSLDCGY